MPSSKVSMFKEFPSPGHKYNTDRGENGDRSKQRFHLILDQDHEKPRRIAEEGNRYLHKNKRHARACHQK